MPKINQEEYEVLKGLDERWKWIARDSDMFLWAYETKPRKFVDSFGLGVPGTDIQFIYGDHFHFVRWEDESPYNIQELIEEYLYDNQPKLFIDGQEQSFEFIEESEEKEVKKLKSVITEFSQESQVVNSWEGSFTGGYLSSIGFAEVEISSESPLDRGEYLGKEVTIIVGDDEPEVLTQEFIDKYKVDYDNWMPAVPIVHLQNLLVPKQEREQKYNVKFNVKSSLGTVGIFLYKKGDEVLAGDNFRVYYPKEDEYRLTEQEIRDFQNGDILFEHFAVKVEELEE